MMRIGKYFVGKLAAGLLLAGSASAATLPPDLAKAAAEYDRAQLEGSRTRLEKMLTSEYKLVNSGAQVESRKQFIDESTSREFKLDPFVITEPIQLVWSNGAVLGGLVHLTGSDAGKRFDAHLRFADVWAKRSGRWQIVYTQVTKVPAVK